MKDTDERGQWLSVPAIGLLILGAVGALLFVPEMPTKHLDEPAYQAVPGTVIILGVVLVLRAFGRRTARVEQWIFAYFLAAMPLVYVSSLARSQVDAAMWIQILGLVLYAGSAFIGLFVWAWALPLGIAAHGLLWDLTHRHAGFIPAWYTDACLVIDVSFALYAASRVKVWQAARSAKTAKGQAKTNPAP